MNTRRLAPIAAAIAVITATAPAAAQYPCYDFNGLAVRTKYNIGDTVKANHAAITFRSYLMSGNPVGGAEFTANFANNSGNWHVGTVALRAKPGGEIKSFSIGGHTWRLDDMCIAK